MVRIGSLSKNPMLTPSTLKAPVNAARVALLRWRSLIAAILAAAPAYAQDKAADIPPSKPVSVVFVILFALVFIGMIVGFFWRLWLNERKHRADGNGSENAI